jgi:hypothetical protein
VLGVKRFFVAANAEAGPGRDGDDAAAGKDEAAFARRERRRSVAAGAIDSARSLPGASCRPPAVGQL